MRRDVSEFKHLLFAAFHDENDANSAIDELAKNGYSAEDISIITKHEFRRGEARRAEEAEPGAGRGVVAGGIIGGIAGLLAGLAGIIITGPLAILLGIGGLLGITITGVVIGAITGGLAGSLARLGLPEERAKRYEEVVHAGGTIIAVPVEDISEEKIRDVLRDNHAEDITELDVEPERMNRERM